jgi:hypothetical protein
MESRTFLGRAVGVVYRPHVTEAEINRPGAPGFSLMLRLSAGYLIVRNNNIVIFQINTMKSAGGILGVLFVWAGSLEWCYEVWNEMWPSGMPILFPLIGVALVLEAIYRTSDWKPLTFSVAALIPPFIVLALRGFRI